MIKQNKINEFVQQWFDIQKIDWAQYLKDFRCLLYKQTDLYDFIDQITMFNRILNKFKFNNDYSQLEGNAKYLLWLLKSTKAKLLSYLKGMFFEVNNLATTNRINKLDKEIWEIKKQIRELKRREKLDDASNHRIEILMDKIKRLETIRIDFKSQTASRISRNAEAYIKTCEEILKDSKNVSVAISLKNIQTMYETDEINKLVDFLKIYLKPLVEFINKSITICESLFKE